jgi:hypothetical protein
LTTYTALSDASLSQDKPVTQSIARAWRDNPLAMGEGDPTAPEIIGVDYFDIKTASGSSSLIFTNLPDSYDVLEWDIVKLFPATSLNQLYMELSTDNGSTWLNSSYVNYFERIVAGTASSGTGSTARFDVTGNPSFNTSSPQTVNGKMRSYSLCNASQTKLIESMVMYFDTTPSLHMQRVHGYHATTSKVNAVRFRFASGNITSGYIGYRRVRPS